MRAPARREQLLDVATELAVERSFHAVTIEAVARRACITRAVVYQHFGDLQALLEAIIAREAARALAQVSETTLRDLSEGDPIELMLESLGVYLGAVRDHPTTWKLILMSPEGAPESLRESIARGRRSVLATLTNAVRPALDRAHVDDAELTAKLLSAVADEYARFVLIDPARYPPERLLRHARWWVARPTFGLSSVFKVSPAGQI